MGQEIENQEFQPEDSARFQQRLTAELELLEQWFAGNKFVDDPLQVGLELEAWLIGLDGNPVPDNSLFLATVDRQSVVPELAKFNFEFNVTPQYLAGDGLWRMQRELQRTWEHCGQAAAAMESRICAIGILPTVQDAMLTLENLSPLRRYAALNDQVLKLRRGRPIRLSIEGTDSLTSTHADLMLESAATSVQVHLKVPARTAVRYYNASLLSSAFTVAMAANAPLLFGRRLWADTRIPLFERTVDTAGSYPRVSFGHRYLEHSLFEYFQHIVRDHHVLLPAELEEPPAKMPYLRMHNGTLWNWNRPLIGFESDGQPHLRIEHRPMSASPSMADLLADTQLYLGLTHYLATQATPPESLLPFKHARENFYAAARYGVNATITWLDGKHYELHQLLSELMGDIHTALQQMEIAPTAIDHSLNTLNARMEAKQNGSSWQLRKFAEYNGDLQRLLLAYVEQQATGKPVHAWD